MRATYATKCSPTVEAFLGESPLSLFIGGQWLASKGKKTFHTFDPGSGATLAEVHDAQAEDLDAAVQAARKLL